MISEKLAGFYTKVEDKYFDLLDFLDSKGVPIYAYSDFFENKGIPSLVVTISIILILLILLGVTLTYQGPTIGQLTLSIRDSDGKALSGVNLIIRDVQEVELFKGTVGDGQKINLKRMLANSEKIFLIAEKTGYKGTSIAFTVGETSTNPKLNFSKEVEAVEAKVRLIDKETKTPVRGALVLLESGATTFELVEDNNSFYKKSGVIGNEELLMRVTAIGYNDYSQRVSFSGETVKEIQLEPSTQTYVGKAVVGFNVYGPDGKLINDAKITVYNKQNNTIEVSDYTRSGSLIASITAGIPLRIVVEKKDYLTYDSDKYGEGITIREKEKQVNINLEQGGQKLHVLVTDSGLGLSLEGAIVQIFYGDATFFAEATTGISGTEFIGVDADEPIYVTAFVEGYLPRVEKINILGLEEIRLILTKVSSTNSTRLDIYSIDSRANPINGVNVIVNKIIDGNLVPSGLPLLQTSFAGYATAVVENAGTYQVIGFNEAFEATSLIEILNNEADKKVYLNMQKKVNVIEMKFVDVFGKVVEGVVEVNALDGTNLYDEGIYDGRIYFNGDQRESVEVNVTLIDGNIFTENVIIKGKDFVEVVVYNKDALDLTPSIEFVGLENENGEKIMGVTPGAFYWAKFLVVYPRIATKGGVHFRVGSDNNPYSQSERIGLFELSMQSASIFYSTSYTKEPLPGNEVIDRANSGLLGEKNKWVEGVVTQPRGNYNIKVKIRAEDYTAGRVQLNYRAWAVIGDEHYRFPFDEELELTLNSEQKSGLYAKTNTIDLVMYESLPTCVDSLCVTTNFIDVEENLLSIENFEALKDKLYALEVEVNSREQDNLKIEVSSDTEIEFDSTQTGQLYFAREESVGTGKKNASATMTVSEGGTQKLRFYFTAREIGVGKINLFVSGKNIVDKEISFKVVNEKNLLVEISEEQVIVGKNFTVRVTDEGLLPITSALIKIVDREGKVIKTILGDDSEGKGRSGYYRVQNNLSVGLYTIEVTYPTYATNTIPLLVTTRRVLAFPPELEVKLPMGQKYITIEADLTNNSDFVIQDISFDVDGVSEYEKEYDYETGEIITNTGFNVEVDLPMALSKNQKQTIPITIYFNGVENESADETVTLTITGLVEGQFVAKVSSELHLIYNRKLDSSCLKIDESNAVINLIGNEGANDSIAIEVTNNCDQPITLKKTIKAKTKLSAIQIDVEDYLDLQAGEVKELIVRAYNWVERVRDESYGFELIFDSNYLKKTINLNVRLINPTLALSYPSQINLFLAQGDVRDKAIASQPIFVTNISAFPVENITFAQSTNYTATGVKVEIQPTDPVNLNRGESITPAKIIFATANSTITEPVESIIEIKGRFANLNNKAAQYDRYQYYDLYNEGAYSLSTYAPQTASLASYANTNRVLGVIKVNIAYSGYNCLKASLADSMGDPYLFPSAGVQLGKMVTVTNLCAEPVMVSGAVPADYKPTTNTYGLITPLASPIMLFVPQVLVQPGAAVKLPLSITTTSPTVKRDKFEIVINGVTQLSQSLISSKPFPVSIYSGINLNEEKSRSTTVKLRECVAPNSKETPKEVELIAPLTTNSTNCAERYCDAVSAAKYLAQKIIQVTQKARSAGYSHKDLASDGFPCQLEGACTFAEIGMDEEELFDLYLQNDAITTLLLSRELNNTSEGGNDTPFREGAYLSTGFLVEPALVDIGYIKQRALSGYGKTIFLDSSFAGCGYYQVSISGAFKSGVEGLDTMSPVLIIRARPINGEKRITTKECQNIITNITNFNPIDAGLNPGKEAGTWLTTINADTIFNEMAKKVSKNRFKTEERVNLSGVGNTIKITQGTLSNALAQICVSGSNKKEIIVTIDSAIASSYEPKQRDAFNESIIKLVSDTLGGNFANNCVISNGGEYNCINLSELGSLGERKIMINNSDLLFSTNKGGCVDATIYSTINEQLNFSAIPLTTPNSFIGVREITISTNDAYNNPLVLLESKKQEQEETKKEDTKEDETKKDGTTSNSGSGNKTRNQESKKPSNLSGGNQEAITLVDLSGGNQEANQSNNLNENSGNEIEKLFFANELPTVTTPQKKESLVNTGLIYEAKFFVKGVDKQVNVDSPLKLIHDLSSNQYKYYRNIKICASPIDTENPTPTNLGDYSKANGVKFEISVRNSMANETREDTKQTITINTGTLHPNDLVKFICDKSIAGKEDYTYYFTTGWMDTLNEEVPELGSYIEGLKREGLIDDCILLTGESGLGGTSAFDVRKSEITEKGLLTFLGVCSAASAACHGFTNPGTTIFGATFGALFDCGAPMLTTYRAEIAQSSGLMKTINNWFNSFGDFAKNLPFGGTLINNMFSIKQEIDDPEAKTGLGMYWVGENIVDGIITQRIVQGAGKMTSPWALSVSGGITSKVLNYSTAIAEGGGIVNVLESAKIPLAIKNVSKEASTELVKPYAETLKNVLGGSLNPQANQLIEELGKELNKDIANSLTKSAAEVHQKTGGMLSINKIGSIAPDSYAEAVKKSLQSTDAKFIELLSKADPITGKTNIQNIFGVSSPDPTRAMTLDELITGLQSKGGKMKDFGDGLALRLVKPTQVTQAAKNAALAICIQKPFNPTDCTSQLTTLFKGDRAKAGTISKVYETKINSMTTAEFNKLRKNLAAGSTADDFIKLIDDVIIPPKSADEGVRELINMTNSQAKKQVGNKVDDLAKIAKATGLGNRAVSLTANIVKGVSCSMGADYAGRTAMENVMKEDLRKLEKEGIKLLDLGVTLQKNKTYSIRVIKKSGTFDYDVREVIDFGEMDKTINEKKGEIISTKKLIEKKFILKETKLPEERKLSYWKINSSLAIAKKLFSIRKYPAEEEEINNQLEVLNDGEIRQLIFDYTNPISKYKITEASESDVIAVMMYFWGSRNTKGVYSQIEVEKRTREGLLRKNVEILVNANKNHDDEKEGTTKLTERELISAFGENILNKKEAEKLKKMISFWSEVEKNSPSVAIPTTNKNAVAKLPVVVVGEENKQSEKESGKKSSGDDAKPSGIIPNAPPTTAS